jgi:hypothetical protein
VKAELTPPIFRRKLFCMAKKASVKVEQVSSLSPKSEQNETGKMPVLRPSSLLDTSVVYCGDNLEQLAKL